MRARHGGRPRESSALPSTSCCRLEWLLRAFVKTLSTRRLSADPQGKTIWLVIVGTIPVGLLGLLFEVTHLAQKLFSAQWPILPAAFLALNGVVLFAGEQLRRGTGGSAALTFKREAKYKRIDDLTFGQALLIGLAQSFALLPGISRSGISMVAGMRAQLDHEEAARFAFLLATPVIGLAALVEIPKLFHAGATTLMLALVGGVIAGIAAFLSVKFLMRYFKVNGLIPFAIYCLVTGILAFAAFATLSAGLWALPW